jgi:hypothetical protein
MYLRVFALSALSVLLANTAKPQSDSFATGVERFTSLGSCAGSDELAIDAEHHFVMRCSTAAISAPVSGAFSGIDASNIVPGSDLCGPANLPVAGQSIQELSTGVLIMGLVLFVVGLTDRRIRKRRRPKR